ILLFTLRANLRIHTEKHFLCSASGSRVAAGENTDNYRLAMTEKTVMNQNSRRPLRGFATRKTEVTAIIR
ncbi:hypothetical protein D6Q01_28025, partial [Salmonella enterica subsp. enterica]|nr:hypothetical protein [Salmonella enterica subsp. enterica]